MSATTGHTSPPAQTAADENGGGDRSGPVVARIQGILGCALATCDEPAFTWLSPWCSPHCSRLAYADTRRRLAGLLAEVRQVREADERNPLTLDEQDRDILAAARRAMVNGALDDLEQRTAAEPRPHWWQRTLRLLGW